jgi:hypothetical protein
MPQNTDHAIRMQRDLRDIDGNYTAFPINAFLTLSASSAPLRETKQINPFQQFSGCSKKTYTIQMYKNLLRCKIEPLKTTGDDS